MSANFAAVAGEYVRCRPSYPDELFTYLGSLCHRRELAWDCGAGSGQASLPLTRCFRRVVATDTSQPMLSRAPREAGILLCRTTAEDASVRGQTVDLVTVAQALHWFEVERFYGEVSRVLVPGGVLAVWTYGNQRVEDEEIDSILARFYHEIVGPFWSPERRHVESGYHTLPFPYPPLKTPTFLMEHRWTLAELLGYVGTWSATQRYREIIGQDPLDALSRQLKDLWGRGTRTIRWPLSVRVGRRPE